MRPALAHASCAAPRRSAPSSAQAGVLRAAARRALPSVVRISTRLTAPPQPASSATARRTAAQSGGTGVIIDKCGLILTNEHVVRNAAEIEVVSAAGTRHGVRSVAADRERDLAVLALDGWDLPALRPAQAVNDVGSPVAAATGGASGTESNIRLGVITSLHASLQPMLAPAGGRRYHDLIESTTELDPGFSGGPLLDSSGRFIGLNVAVAGAPGGAQRRGYAIPFDVQVQRTIARLCAQARGNQ